MKKKRIRILAAAICLVLLLAGPPATALADGASDWDEVSFEAQNDYRIFDIDSGLPFLGYHQMTYYGKDQGLDVVAIRAICPDAAGNPVFGTDAGRQKPS